MKSPFPGMDPYIERYWGDVHTSMATYARDQLRSQLPRDLVVRVEEHVALESGDGDENLKSHGYYPDVRIEEYLNGSQTEREATAIATLSETIRIPRNREPRTHRSVRVIEPRSGNRIVTAIEILSPGNKVGTAGRKAYQKKRDKLIASGASLVEIDLIRVGRNVIAAPTAHIPSRFRGPYRVCVVRAWQAAEAELYRVSLRQRLPIIQVPLRKSDAEASLDLQALIDMAYENGSYDRTDYRSEPISPLNEEDAKWADQLLREKGLRA